MSEDHGPLAGRHVLLVEDDYFIAFDMQRHFETSGAHVLGPAPSVREALALISGAARIDAAVLDINLRGEMAFAVADELAARGVPFLFTTGYSRRPFRRVTPPSAAARSRWSRSRSPACCLPEPRGSSMGVARLQRAASLVEAVEPAHQRLASPLPLRLEPPEVGCRRSFLVGIPAALLAGHREVGLHVRQGREDVLDLPEQDLVIHRRAERKSIGHGRLLDQSPGAQG
ncbi:hypothetical protein [Methylobacterium oxalidis]|uniref:hypothetical protein n=1 Tax=Methylobacterium oxalidis TaxID=944322 RepID=UPI0035A246B1